MRYSKWDALLVALSLVHGAVLVLAPSATLIALGLWWNANTISHNFIHLPFFRSRTLNRMYSAYLSVLLGIPQALWRYRHLVHHTVAAVYDRRQCHRSATSSAVIDRRYSAVEFFLILASWTFLCFVAPRFFLATYLPGYFAGLALCYIHGRLEHARGVSISHYGAVYNLTFFNDGFHVEHHVAPREHWTRLPVRLAPNANSSSWPAVLRWIEYANLETLERFVLRSRTLQRFVLRNHESAFRKLLAQVSNVRRIKIVGGALFPRTALVLKKLLPDAQITIVDADSRNIQTAKAFLNGDVEFVNATYEIGAYDTADLIVIPLCLIGDRAAVYERPPARATLVHDWIWRKRGESAIVSPLLLKRLNLIKS